MMGCSARLIGAVPNFRCHRSSYFQSPTNNSCHFFAVSDSSRESCFCKSAISPATV